MENIKNGNYKQLKRSAGGKRKLQQCNGKKINENTIYKVNTSQPPAQNECLTSVLYPEMFDVALNDWAHSGMKNKDQNQVTSTHVLSKT